MNDESYLRPETQDLEAFVDGMNNITEAQQRVALQAFEDSSIEDACPPLHALLSIMAQHQAGVRKAQPQCRIFANSGLTFRT